MGGVGVRFVGRRSGGVVLMDTQKVTTIEYNGDGEDCLLQTEDGSETYLPLRKAQQFVIGEVVELVPQTFRKIKKK